MRRWRGRGKEQAGGRRRIYKDGQKEYEQEAHAAWAARNVNHRRDHAGNWGALIGLIGLIRLTELIGIIGLPGATPR